MLCADFIRSAGTLRAMALCGRFALYLYVKRPAFPAHHSTIFPQPSMVYRPPMADFDVFRLDGHALRVFLTVFETRSVSKTAELFNLNQSTISHTLQKIRAAIGDPLFIKSGRGITPTARAVDLAPRVQEVVGRIEGLIASDEYNAAIDNNPIIIGIPSPALMTQMRDVYTALQAEAPNAVLHVVRLAPRERIPEVLDLGEVDVAIALRFAKYPASLSAKRYRQDQLVVFFDPRKRGPIRSVEQYLEAKHGVAGFGGSTKSIVELALEEMGLLRRVSFVSPTASSLGQMVLGTDMICTMPLGLADNAFSKLSHCPPPFSLPPLVYDLIWHKRLEHSGRNAWIRNLVCSNS